MIKRLTVIFLVVAACLTGDCFGQNEKIAKIEASIKSVTEKATADLRQLRDELESALNEHEQQLRKEGRNGEADEIKNRRDATKSGTSSDKIALSKVVHSLQIDGFSRPYFVISCNAKNMTATTLASAEIHVRRIRAGRPLPDFEWKESVEIKGGIAAKETIPWALALPSNALGVKDSPNIRNGESLQISLDGKKWIDVPRSSVGDPMLRQLLDAKIK